LKLTRIAHAMALIGLAGHALAQTPPAEQPQKLEKVTVTGSSIKRLADQKALPIETFSRADIEKRGISGAEELVEMLSANVAGANNRCRRIPCSAPTRIA
jgi:iron complex outermembrane receptor protein